MLNGKPAELESYGLAKAAGDSTQSASSNVVGTYTDEAKVAIQKMLGVYRAPIELITTITLEENGGFDISTDSNGDPLNLVEAIVKVTIPANSASVTNGCGRYLFVDNANEKLYAETSKYVTKTDIQRKVIHAHIDNGFGICKFIKQTNDGASGQWQSKLHTGIKYAMGNITRIYMNEADEEPAGTTFEIYGRKSY